MLAWRLESLTLCVVYVMLLLLHTGVVRWALSLSSLALCLLDP